MVAGGASPQQRRQLRRQHVRAEHLGGDGHLHAAGRRPVGAGERPGVVDERSPGARRLPTVAIRTAATASGSAMSTRSTWTGPDRPPRRRHAPRPRDRRRDQRGARWRPGRPGPSPPPARFPEVAPVTTTTRPSMRGGSSQASSRRRSAMPTRLKLGATVASATASTAVRSDRRARMGARSCRQGGTEPGGGPVADAPEGHAQQRREHRRRSLRRQRGLVGHGRTAAGRAPPRSRRSSGPWRSPPAGPRAWASRSPRCGTRGAP